MPANPKKKERREDWRARADEMRANFRDEFSNANRTQYYVGDPAPDPGTPPGGHGRRAQLARKLDRRGDMRNQQLYDFVQKRGTLFRPGDPGAPGTNPDPGYLPPDPNAAAPTPAAPSPSGDVPSSAADPFSASSYSTTQTPGGLMYNTPNGSFPNSIAAFMSMQDPNNPIGALQKLVAPRPATGSELSGISPMATSNPFDFSSGPYTPPASSAAPPMAYGSMYSPGPGQGRRRRRPRRPF